MMASRYATALITDSTSDIPPILQDQFGIYVVPQYVIWGAEELRDRIDIEASDFYARLERDPIPPKTSQPTAFDFEQVIQQAEADGAQDILIVTISHQLSGTNTSALQAAETAKVPVRVIDSLSVAMGLGWEVLAAARCRQAGGDLEAMVRAVESAREAMQFFFVLNTLEYLHRGGRIGGAAKLIGTLLSLKPILYVDHDSGRVEPGEKIRTLHRAVDRLYSTFFENIDSQRPMHIAVEHSNSPALAEEIYCRIQQDYHAAELIVSQISPVVGTHAGPGGVGIIGYYEK